MSELSLLQRRLAIGMGLAGVLAFASAVGPDEAATPLLAGVLLFITLFKRLGQRTSAALEPIWLPIAFLLMARAAYQVGVAGGDVVLPVVDLLLLLICAEGLRALGTANEVRIYGLSFALLLAATAYRPGAGFAIAFAAYVALAAPALTIGHLARRTRRYGAREPRLGRPVALATSLLTGAALIACVVVFLVLPRASQGFAARTPWVGAQTVGFSDQVSIGAFGASILGNPAVVLRVEFPGGRPPAVETIHWRGRSYDRFDGVRWSRSERIRPSAGASSWYRTRWPGPVLPQRIYASGLDTRVLFGMHPMVGIETEEALHPLMDNVGDFFYWGSGTPTYTAYSVMGRPSPDELRSADGSFVPDRNYYLQLPELPARIRALADSLTAGAETDFDRVRRIESWLRSEFTYQLALPATAAEATLDHFLFERRAGHCEYFSTAMVVLLRSVGIHARNVNGFLGGTWSDLGNYLAVTQNDAHSWVEVWFPGFGWVTFDPTPAASGDVGRATSWLWPGRFLLDAVQHRWGKWVLDYDREDQWGAIGRALAAVSGRDAAGGGAPAGDGPNLVSWGLMLAMLAIAALLLLGRSRPAGSPETRAYLELVGRCRAAGVVRGQIAPLELVRRLRDRAGASVAAPAARLVALYTRARFAGVVLADEERAEMTSALAAARVALDARRSRERSGAGPDLSGGRDR